MKINDWKILSQLENDEKRNIWDYLLSLAQWTYKYIHEGNKPLLTRVKAVYKNGDWRIENKKLSPDEIGVIALACRHFMPDFPRGDKIAEKEFAEYQYKLQSYLWITDPEVVTQFYQELVTNIKPEHNKLIPILHTYHTQIHALKIAYDSMKWSIWSANITTRVIFGLVCIELMKLQVRLYLVEPLARTEEWKNLDWIYMLDKVFYDFKWSRSNTESIRRKNVVDINPYQDLWFQWVLDYIRYIRDEVDELKRKKQWIPDERKEELNTPSSACMDIISTIKRRTKGL